MSQSNYITLALFTVIGLVFIIDFYVRNKNKKSNSTDLDFPGNISKPNNFLITSVISVVVIIISFFSANYYLYDGELTNSDDSISLIDNVIYKKLSMNDIVEQDSIWLFRKNMSPVSCIIREKGENIGIIIDGLKEGLWQERYENGQLKYRRTYSKGLLDFKIAEVWWENGQLINKVFKRNHPEYKPTIKFEKPPEYIEFNWTSKGLISHKKAFAINKNGAPIMHGVCINYDYSSTRESTYLSEEYVSYNDEKLSGPYKKYFENGLLELEYLPNKENYYEPINRTASTITGKVKVWHENGTLKSEYFVKGEISQPVGIYKEFDKNGKIIKDGEFNDRIFNSKFENKNNKPSILSNNTRPQFSKLDHIARINNLCSDFFEDFNKSKSDKAMCGIVNYMNDYAFLVNEYYEPTSFTNHSVTWEFYIPLKEIIAIFVDREFEDVFIYAGEEKIIGRIFHGQKLMEEFVGGLANGYARIETAMLNVDKSKGIADFDTYDDYTISKVREIYRELQYLLNDHYSVQYEELIFDKQR